MKTKSWTRGHKSYPEDTWEHACVALHIPSIRKDEIESEWWHDSTKYKFDLCCKKIVEACHSKSKTFIRKENCLISFALWASDKITFLMIGERGCVP